MIKTTKNKPKVRVSVGNKPEKVKLLVKVKNKIKDYIQRQFA